MANHICHFEIGCRDRVKTAQFYAEMFDWTLGEHPHGTFVRTGGDVGGHINALGHEPYTYTIFYVMVDDVERALTKAERLGGRRLVGPVALPNDTLFGWFADPEGNTIGVYGEATRSGHAPPPRAEPAGTIRTGLPEESDAGIEALYAAWRDAFARCDVEAVLNLVTPDYVLWAAGRPPMTRDMLRPRLIEAFDAYDVVASFEREERILSGNLAFERGWDVQRVTPRRGGDRRTQRQRVFLVLRRDDEGRWRFARGMSDPTPAP